jgi:predicted transcriptional regulator
MLIRKKLKAVLISIADAAHNDSDTGVLDTLMYEQFNNVPRTEVNDYLYELKAYGLIEISPKESGVDYGLVNITRKGLQLLQDQHLKSDRSD